jgi:hypothetical protein
LKQNVCHIRTVRPTATGAATLENIPGLNPTRAAGIYRGNGMCSNEYRKRCVKAKEMRSLVVAPRRPGSSANGSSTTSIKSASGKWTCLSPPARPASPLATTQRCASGCPNVAREMSEGEKSACHKEKGFAPSFRRAAPAPCRPPAASSVAGRNCECVMAATANV